MVMFHGIGASSVKRQAAFPFGYSGIDEPFAEIHLRSM